MLALEPVAQTADAAGPACSLGHAVYGHEDQHGPETVLYAESEIAADANAHAHKEKILGPQLAAEKGRGKLPDGVADQIGRAQMGQVHGRQAQLVAHDAFDCVKSFATKVIAGVGQPRGDQDADLPAAEVFGERCYALFHGLSCSCRCLA